MKKFFTLLSICLVFGLFLAGCDTNKVKVNLISTMKEHLPALPPKELKRFKNKRTD